MLGGNLRREVSLKTLLSDLLAFAKSHETTLIGAAVSLVVLVAGDLHIVLSSATVTEVVAPLVAGLLADLRLSTKAPAAK
jgi:hypothetical protein